MKKIFGFSVLISKIFTLLCLSVSFFNFSNVYADVSPCHEVTQKHASESEGKYCGACVQSKTSWEVQAINSSILEEKIVKDYSFVSFENSKEDSIVFSTHFFERPPPDLFVTAQYTLRKQIIVLRV